MLNEPSAVSDLVSRVTVASLRDAPLRAILQACYDLHGEGRPPRCEDVLLAPRRSPGSGPGRGTDSFHWTQLPLPEDVRPASWEDRLNGVLATLAERERQERLRDLEKALAETDRERTDPDAYRALQLGICYVS